VPVFVDAYGETRETARSIAGDMHDWIFQHPLIEVYDWTDPANPVASDMTIEFEYLEGPLTPQAALGATDLKKHWKVIKVMANVFYIPDYYPPGGYGFAYLGGY
jgi:hypothetical protein